ncbi:MAG: hypothetical protein LBN02_08095 [Oscillospiraceae bacterium]|jgi:hypothetical protein|nr:hypothetical protein [Oscillospiraceae bacterium]
MFELPMRAFRINGTNGHIEYTLHEVYDTHVIGLEDTEGALDIRADGFSARGTLWASIFDLFDFCSHLKQCYESVSGEVVLRNPDRSFELNLSFKNSGHVSVIGVYKERYDRSNELNFEFETDQADIFNVISELEQLQRMFNQTE